MNNNKRATKRALLTSVMALVMCVVMLVGTTFAWFTDTASTGVNRIQAGNLDIKVEYTLDGENWADLTDGTDLFGNGRFEPGYTRVVAYRITNNGSLALKYNMSMNLVNETKGINKDGKEFALSDYLKVKTSPVQEVNTIGDIMVSIAFDRDSSKAIGWTESNFKDTKVMTNDKVLAAGQQVYFIMQVYMPTSVGNEANAISTDKTPSIDFGINFVATQATVEKDSYDHLYDKDATYPALISTSQEMIDALKNGGTVTVGDITLDGEIGADGNVNPDCEMQLVNAGDIELTLDGTVTSGNISGYAWGCMRVMPGTKLVISAGENGRFINTATQSAINVCGGDVVVNGGYFESAGYGFFVYTDNDEAASKGMSLTINGGTFKAAWGVVDVTGGMNATVTINGGTFIGWDPTAYVNAETHTVTNTNGTYTVTAK